LEDHYPFGGAAQPAAVFGIHAIAQVDNIYLVLVLLPAAMLAIRRVRTENLIRPFVGLALSMTALAFWGFLQEVAYAFCFLAAYALYRAAICWKSGPRASLGVLIVFGISAVVALLFAAPRIIALSSEFFQFTRTSSSRYSGYQELLRFFHEGIYGRYFAEGPPEGTSLNLHEGLQLLSSTTVVLFVCFGLLRSSRRSELGISVLLFAMILAVVPIYLKPASAHWPSQELINIFLYACIVGAIMLLLRMGRRFLRLGPILGTPAVPRPPDTAFHVFALVLILFLVVVPEGYYGVYLLFGRVDFTHGRLSLLALLPLCSLFAVYLTELKSLPSGADRKRGAGLQTVAAALGLILAAAVVSWLIHGPVGAQDGVSNQTVWGERERCAARGGKDAADHDRPCCGFGRVSVEASVRLRWPHCGDDRGCDVRGCRNGDLRAFQDKWVAKLDLPCTLRQPELYGCSAIGDAATE
jgi:hypothetical protein